jgi:release factor glutamine methyltransferase
MIDVEGSHTWAELRAEVARYLDSDLDARLIVEQVLGDGSWLSAIDQTPAYGDRMAVKAMVERRKTGEPLQYVLGEWAFRSLTLHVNSQVLIPRPETEQMVEAALPLIKSRERPVVVDLGTGSGAIALSIASELPHAEVHATDGSPDALAIARANQRRVGVNIETYLGSWFEALPVSLKGQIDMIITNPPYVAEARPERVEQVVHEWEPHEALYAGPDGLDDIRVIVAGAAEWLKPDGHLVLELDPDQASEVQSLAQAGGFASASIGHDFTGRARWVIASRLPV